VAIVGRPGVILQRLAELDDGVGHGVVADQGAAPDLSLQVLTRDDLTLT
jgi:hypothetical protein